ncbi:MAG: tripartite tricarboxylate transporter TctB family protein [Burkholderiales bacterium]|nr:MAG: tripartite tricarboxylate transporter TctB family protein [Burkholderiales bacterium]
MTRRVTHRLRRVLPHAAMLAISVLLYWAALQIDTRGAEGGRRIGPDFWPKLVIAIMVALCVFEIVKRLVVKTPSTSGATPGEPASIAPAPIEAAPGVPLPVEAARVEPVAPAPTSPGRLWAGNAAIAGFALAVDWVGFFVATAAFLAVFMLIGGMRRPLLATAIGVAGSFGLIVIFMRVAYISLPLGAGPFRELSLALLRLLGVS